jgi:CubicO group peptidase (beta-lactamase class C family)
MTTYEAKTGRGARGAGRDEGEPAGTGTGMARSRSTRLGNQFRSLSLLLFLLVASTLVAGQKLQATSPTAPVTIPSPILDPNSAGWASVRNMTSDQYSQFFGEQSRAGMMPVDIEVDEINNTQRVGAVWQRNLDGRGWIALRNMTASQFEANLTQYRNDGFRLIEQEVYLLGTTTYYAGIWIQNVEGLEWTSYTNRSSAEFAELFQRYRDQGLLMIDIDITPPPLVPQVAIDRGDEGFPTENRDSYAPSSHMLYSAVWVENSEGLAWQEWRDMTSAQFGEKFEELKGTYRMIDIESYTHNGVQHYAGIWVENKNGRGWAEWRDMTAKQFGDRWLILRDAGYRLINYEVYSTPSGWRYAGIWRQNSERPNWPFKGQVDNLVETFQETDDVPGVSVGVYHQGKLVYLRGVGFADVDDEIIAQSRTIYRTASVAKAVAGVLGIELSEKGLLDLAASTASYIPGLPAPHTHTVAQTITSRSGIGHYTVHGSMIDDHYDTALDAVKDLWHVPPEYLPGTWAHYSTDGYTFLGAAIEGATGASITDALRTHLSDPFNLKSLRPEDRSIPHPFRATVYNSQNQEFLADDVSWKVLGGGMESSVYDLVRFGAYLVNEAILDEDSLALMWTKPDSLLSTKNNKPSSYAYGWSVGTHVGRPIVAKSGGQPGANSYILIYPDDDLVIAVLTNRWGGHSSNQLSKAIGQVILGAGGSGNQPQAAPATPASFLQFEEIDEPESEAQDPAELIYPQVNPVGLPDPGVAEDDEEVEDEYALFLPVVRR